METESAIPPTQLFIVNSFGKASDLMEEEGKALEEMKGFCLKFYEWENKSITFGHFFKCEEFLKEEALKPLGIDSAKRPTGGGAIFHLDDLSFSLLIPKNCPLFRENTLESYRTINDFVGRALKKVFDETPTFFEKSEAFHPFCMARPTIYDLMLFGKKIGGAAQRRTNKGILHQSSIQLKMPEEALLRAVLKNPDSAILAMQQNSFCLQKNEEMARIQSKLKTYLTELFSGI